MKPGCGLCRRYGRGCQFHPGEAKSTKRKPAKDADREPNINESELTQLATESSLSVEQYRAIEYLIAKKATETITDIAEKVPCARVTIWRWMRKPEFVAALRTRVEDELGGHRARVSEALAKGALRPGPGQAAMQKLFWDKLGELAERLEITGKDGKPLHPAMLDPSKLSDETLRRIIKETREDDDGKKA